MKQVIFYSDSPISGGAEKHMLLLAKNLNPENYRVTLVCSKYRQLNEWCNQFKAAGITVVRLNVIHKHDPRQLWQLKRIFQETHPHILHVHLWNPGSCRYAFMAVNAKETKVIATEHDPFALTSLKKSFKERCLKKTDHTIAVSDANREMLLQLYPELKGKISTIHNGIDQEAFEKELQHFSIQERQKIRQNLFRADGNNFVILTVAALHPRKGLKFLIRAFAEIKKSCPKSRLAIIGEGPQKKQLQNLIKKLDFLNDILLLGHQDNIPKILKSSDLFVLPSIKEAFGLVLLEAMAAQLPIVAANVGGIPEIVQNHKSGELVEPASAGELAEKIIELIANEPLRQKLAFVGHHRVKNFDIKEMAKKTEEVYDKTLLT